ncbi:MAG: hypothetical protein J6X86_04195 [Bacteroidales bacterium]|nr:hypothetical protein [Bacteroidales bacterium]
MKVYSILLFIAVAAFISSGVRANTPQEVYSATVDSVNRTQEKLRMEYVSPDTVIGRFVSLQEDTILFRRYSNKSHRYIDSLPKWGDNFEVGDDIDWFRENDIVMKVVTTDGRVIHTENDAMFVHCAIPLPGLVQGYDVLAVIWKHQDFSGFKSCHMVGMKDGQWKELGSFDVNTNMFPETLTPGIIDGFLERKNGVWMYRDYGDQMRWMEKHDGDCPMKPLKKKLGRRNLKRFFK